MDNKNPIWSRRTNTSNLSLSTNQTDSAANPRDYSSLSRRNGPTSSHGRSIPFNSAPAPGGGLASPSATGPGGGSTKTPKTPGNPFEMAMGMVGSKTPSAEKSSKEALRSTVGKQSILSFDEKKITPSSHALLDTWVFWTRPPISKANGYIEYEKTIHPIAQAQTAEEFSAIYKHLKPPSALPVVTDYHLFKKGVRPIWEDDENKQGGKWVLRLKKGIADRYWGLIQLACIGGQFGEGEDDVVNGAVLSVRNGEDIISIWTASTGQRVLKIRDTMRLVLACPSDTRFEFKSHDESMQQRASIDEQRREKAAANHHHGEGGKRTSRHNDNNNPRQSQEEQRS
ncbi:translation initiation factor eIF 4e-like domain-containing protein [Pseudomassariella vexata]|uniref:Translation initiation factor eIF 4e-like domain-containing protein n=1 Tax=Pseudomassariella vexata TaxID=1141098 RepID=A0A1Y2EJC6_9PEZI|nr:translation initiation factor eIF 4e-like domain-containing protein [Pseudomassariella vexata]ORY71673.1 translation initiation factor eIF 4e-like domain-containing protein [Pseudomassariella vexata]